MGWILVLAFAALAAAVAIAARRGLLALQESRHDAWTALAEQIAKRQQLAAGIVALCSRPMPLEHDILHRATTAGSALLAALKEGDIPALAAADKSFRSAFAALFAASENHPQLSASPGFAALRERAATLDARVDQRREQYNSAVSVLNFRCRAFPYNLVARSMGLQPSAFLP